MFPTFKFRPEVPINAGRRHSATRRAAWRS